MAAALGLTETRAPLDAVVAYLRQGPALVVLDTCEHLAQECAEFAEALLVRAPDTRVLATSRHPLNVPAEHLYQAAPMSIGSDGGDALTLFEERAAAVLPGFAVDGSNRADVIRLCRRLDGLPLAIELATTWLRAVPMDVLHRQVEDRFRVLDIGQRGSGQRQRAMRTVIDWSRDLCTPAERLLWARLSVFRGPFDVDAAEQVCAGGELTGFDVVQALVGLVDKSVVQRIGPDGRWYRMLDTLREYGDGMLAEHGGSTGLRRAHARYLAALTEDFNRDFLRDALVPRYRALYRQHADIRAAFDHCLQDPESRPLAVVIMRGLWFYWVISGMFTEARLWCEKIAAQYPPRRAWPSPRRVGIANWPSKPVCSTSFPPPSMACTSRRRRSRRRR
ncbi:ATP-binding protein [Streptomyces sp. NPDC050085]|uniref:ATP-binding protein n=1 Tax=Streptomyces sp. NPDC050085 TaxID=3365600 RepID=UPI0037B403F1